MTDSSIAIEDRATGRPRSVAVHECGDPSGTPLIHFHGTPGSRLEADFGHEIAARAGVRVIGFDRPGYGASDAAPISAVGIAHDAESIADHLGLERFAVSAWSVGTLFRTGNADTLGAMLSVRDDEAAP